MYTYKIEWKLANRYTSYFYIILLILLFFQKIFIIPHNKWAFHIYSLAYVTHDDHYIRPEQKRVPLYLKLIQHNTYP